jgi:hypothetical protein
MHLGAMAFVTLRVGRVQKKERGNKVVVPRPYTDPGVGKTMFKRSETGQACGLGEGSCS